MRAVEYQGGRTVAVVDRVPEEPGPHDVRIAVSYVGLCGTDLHVYLGDADARVGVPAVIGHEMSGHVESVGADATDLVPGQLVTVMPTRYCGHCPACERGHPNVCYDMDFIGMDSPGALQELWTVPEHLVVPVEPSVGARRAALLEPLTVAVHDVRRSGLGGGERVLVVGGGPIGLLIAMVAGVEGAEVLLSEPSVDRRAIAESLGIRTIDAAGPDLGRGLDDFCGGAGFDVAFEVSGSASGIASAVASLAAHGRVVQVAIHAQAREVDLHRFFWREIEMYGARLYHREDMDRAAELLAQGVIPVEELISGVVPMERTGDAFARLARGDAMKLLVDIDSGGTR